MKHLLVIPALLIGSSQLFGFGSFSPVSGVNGQAGHQDGTGGGAIFNDPMGLIRDAQGNLYVCDARNHVIRKISPAGIVTTLAGTPGAEGALDGIGSAARLRFPTDITISPTGDLYVTDSGNHCIRKVTPNGTVTTLAGNLGSADDVTQDYGSTYTVVAPQLDGKGSAARFNGPSGIAYAPSGLLYVSDTGNQIIRRVAMDGTVTTLAGMPGVWGSANGSGTTARFNTPMGMCIGGEGNIYIADSNNHVIRCMTPQGAVTTYSGCTTEHGCQSGDRLEARYCAPSDITPHPDGGFIICESFGNSLFRMKEDGTVSMYAGGQGSQPSPNTLSNPSAAVCDEFGNVYVADTFNQEIRLIIDKFGIAISQVGAERQLTITWDSLPGRTYQLQILSDGEWIDAPHEPVLATETSSNISFPIPNDAPKGLYRILLLGF